MIMNLNGGFYLYEEHGDGQGAAAEDRWKLLPFPVISIIFKTTMLTKPFVVPFN